MPYSFGTKATLLLPFYSHVYPYMTLCDSVIKDVASEAPSSRACPVCFLELPVLPLSMDGVYETLPFSPPAGGLVSNTPLLPRPHVPIYGVPAEIYCLASAHAA